MCTHRKRSSAFYPEQISTDHTAAPSSVSRITAQVLGALIGAQVLKLEGYPGETIEMVDRVIAEAVDRAIEDLDMPEIKRAYDARAEARRVARTEGK